MSLTAAGSVKTTWKYSTGSRSAWRASSQRWAAVAWHLGQWRLRHELKEISWLLQPSQRKTCPPSAAVRHCSMADMTLSWPRLRCARCAQRQAGPRVRKMSATSRAGRATPAALRGLQRVERADDLAQDLCCHLGVERGGLELLVTEQHLDDADVRLA